MDIDDIRHQNYRCNVCMEKKNAYVQYSLFYKIDVPLGRQLRKLHVGTFGKSAFGESTIGESSFGYSAFSESSLGDLAFS